MQKLLVKVGDKRSLAPDRWEALQALAKIDSEEAIDAMLTRFTFYVDPSITDQEEKDAAFNSIVSKGQTAVGPLKRFIRKAESITWALKMLDRVLPAGEVLEVLLGLLREMDTEYERDPQRKLQVLAELEARHGPEVLAAAKPFLQDVNETARFHAVGAVLAQDGAEAAKDALLDALGREDSMRTKARILDGFAGRGWSIDAANMGKLPDVFVVDANGVPRRR